MRLTKVIIRNFKRFEEVVFELPEGHVVIAGPNNAGKTTFLQAIATWRIALNYWMELGDTNARRAYVKAPITRQMFFPVPLPQLDDLWHGAKPEKGDIIEITLFFEGTGFPMEIYYDTAQQFYARPTNDSIWSSWFRDADDLPQSNIVFIPAMTGISVEEPKYEMPKIEQLLGEGKPGDVLRNLLVKAHASGDNWKILHDAIKTLFDYELSPPDTRRANIRAEYTHKGVKLDIISAGSGFLQVLMLLSFLTVNKNAVLLLDEPDAHLHILLQDRIYTVLQELVAASKSTLIMATHSERIINTTPIDNLCVLIDKPRKITDSHEKKALITAMTTIDNTDLMLAQQGEGLFPWTSGRVLYVEGRTDIDLLREWAGVVKHPLHGFLQRPFWKPTVLESQSGGIKSEEHFDGLKLANSDIIGMELRDSDGNEKRSSLKDPYPLSNNLYRFFWERYEIESYLLHPASIANFVLDRTGQKEAAEKAMKYMKDNFPPKVFEDPLCDHEYLRNTKGKRILSNIFQSAGMERFEDYSQLAAAMPKEAIPKEVIDKLDAIAKKFGLM